MITQEQVRRLVLALPEVAEGEHRGRPDFRVDEKIFATLPTGEASVNIKINPVTLQALVTAEPRTFSDVWGGKWVGVDLERVDSGALLELLREAWLMVAPLKLQRAHPELGRR